MARAPKKAPAIPAAAPAPAADPYVAALKADFRNMAFLIWRHLSLPAPTDLQNDIGQYLQEGPKRRIVMAFRGAAKSWLTAAYAIWRLYRDPDTRVLVVSAGEPRAVAFSTFVLRLINEIPELAHLKPGPTDRQSALAFDVGGSKADQTPSVRAVGIMGQLTGGRADVIVADDVETPNTSGTEAARLRLQERVKEFDALLKPGGEIIYLGTPQIEQSLYFELEARGYQCRIWPARYPTPDQRPAYAERLSAYCDRPDLAGRPTEPTRFSDDDLAERELSYGRSGFALQYMLDPRASDRDRYPLKLRDLIVMDLSDPTTGPTGVSWGSSPELLWKDLPVVGMSGDRLYRPLRVSTEWLPWAEVVMAIDPSGRGKDETAYAVVAHLCGRLFLLDSGGFRGGYDESILKALGEVAKKFACHRVLLEANFGQGMFGRLLQPYLPGVKIEDHRAAGQKETRIIAALEPLLNQHRLVVDASLLRKDHDSVLAEGYRDLGDRATVYRLAYQLTRLTKDRGSLAHDDRLDALSDAVRYFVDKMVADADKAEVDAHAERLREALENFDDLLSWANGLPPQGGPSKTHSWLGSTLLSGRR